MNLRWKPRSYAELFQELAIALGQAHFSGEHNASLKDIYVRQLLRHLWEPPSAHLEEFKKMVDELGRELQAAKTPSRERVEAQRRLTKLDVKIANALARRGLLTERDGVNRRARYATGLAVRLLPPEDRERYRQEFASELHDLPRIDRAPYAFRLVGHSWSLRRSLRGKPPIRATSVGFVLVAGAADWAALAAAGWPAAAMGGAGIAAVAWTISSADRTDRLASLIRAARRK